MSIGIYKITSPKGKIYIGQSMNIEKRFIHYKNSGAPSQPKIDRSFKKYGFANHVCEIIEICDESLLNERECHYISLFDTFQTDHGMNCRSGGAFGRHSSYSNELNRQAHLGKKDTDQTKEKKRLAMAKFKGIKRDPEIGRKISEAKKGVKFSDAQKKNMSISRRNSQAVKRQCKINAKNQGKTVIDTVSGETWASAKEAAAANGMNQYTLTPKLNGTFKNNTNLKYL